MGQLHYGPFLFISWFVFCRPSAVFALLLTQKNKKGTEKSKFVGFQGQ